MSQGWDTFWMTRDANHDLISRELASDRWNLIKDEVQCKYGSLDGKRAVEVGAGMGTNCLCMALMGAEPSLLDVEPMAFRRAEELFAGFGLAPQCIQTDILQPLDRTLADHFDVVMSFGLVEHFVGTQRELCMRRHFELAKPGGLVIVSVPSWSSFVLRADTAVLQFARRWRWGWQRFSRRRSFDWEIEVPFRRREMEEMAKRMCTDSTVYSTNFGEGINSLLRWLRYPVAGVGLEKLSSRLTWSWAPMPMLDRRWGVSLVMIAQKDAVASGKP